MQYNYLILWMYLSVKLHLSNILTYTFFQRGFSEVAELF